MAGHSDPGPRLGSQSVTLFQLPPPPPPKRDVVKKTNGSRAILSDSERVERYALPPTFHTPFSFAWALPNSLSFLGGRP